VGLVGATGVGIGAIVGGGILVLAGVAFQSTGPSALLAFTFNGAIAVLTALSYAEMSTAFPESGGTYTFAKKVLSVRAAFGVGWILWLAYIVAGVLYALGFAEYAVAMVVHLWKGLSSEAPPPWLIHRNTVLTFALAAVAAYTLALIRKSTGGGQWATVGKVVVFCVLIIAGLWALAGRPSGTVSAGLTPFFPRGAPGLLQAMGFTFIALQGFDLVAAIAGEIRAPTRTIPRAMLLSLGAALVIYLPLLFLVSTVGVQPGQSITELSHEDPETIMAIAVRNYMGPTGYWLVMVAAVLSTLSALHANLLAASRVALSMARHRTLPHVLSRVHGKRRTPVMAIYASALAMVVIAAMVADLAAAGAAASLIFLISFAMAHWTAILARRRSAVPPPFRTPAFPVIPVTGGLACVVLAVFQGVAVPAASAITVAWLGLGVLLYFALFASRAQAMDAFAEAHDPRLVRLRGRNPLVLVPVANPASAAAMVAVANALAPPQVGRVLLLSVMAHGSDQEVTPDQPPQALLDAQKVLQQALTAALASGHAPEALMTIAPMPWAEISRVARSHACESLVLGMAKLSDHLGGGHLERLLNDLDCDVAVLGSPPGWEVTQAKRIVVPVGGQGSQEELRARLLGSLCRTAKREITFLRVMPPESSAAVCEEARRHLAVFADVGAPGIHRVLVIRSAEPVSAIAEHAEQADLVVLGLQRVRGRKLFGEVAVRIADEIPCATIMLSQRG
jgi:APA family basic amino acid/polyamine antiporter